MNTVSGRIRKAREAKGWTQSYLAKKIRVNTSTICGYETDRITPKLFIAADLCKALNISLNYLVYGKE